MNLVERWIRWEPVSGLSKTYYLVSAVEKIEGFEILLADENDDTKKLRITFENSIDSYQITDETYRLKTFEELNDQYGSIFYSQWSLFKISNSNYLRWLSEQSRGISDTRPLMHFSFFTTNLILDVIASYEPRVELIENSDQSS